MPLQAQVPDQQFGIRGLHVDVGADLITGERNAIPAIALPALLNIARPTTRTARRPRRSNRINAFIRRVVAPNRAAISGRPNQARMQTQRNYIVEAALTQGIAPANMMQTRSQSRVEEALTQARSTRVQTRAQALLEPARAAAVFLLPHRDRLL